MSELDMLLDCYARFVDLLAKGGYLLKIDAAILSRLVRLMLPNATPEELAEYDAEIRALVGLQVDQGYDLARGADPAGELDLLLDRYARFVDLLSKAGNLPKTEARILTRLVQMMIPDATVSELAEFVAEIRAHVGLDDNA